MKQIDNNPFVAAEKYNNFRFYDILNKALL